MEFRIAKPEFLRGLRLAQGIADRKSTMPMLANVLLRTQGKNQLLVAATDLNVSLTAELKSTNASEGGLTLGAKNLYELVANAPGDEITLKKADNHWAEIKSGKVTYRIVGMPDRDFPKVPDHREATYTTLDSAVLREMIDRTLFSVCNDETRYHLNGVFFESDGSKSRMVSTDGHRLSKVERTIADGPKLSAGVIIPKKGLLEIKKVLEQGPSCKLAIKTPHLFLAPRPVGFTARLVGLPAAAISLPPVPAGTIVGGRNELDEGDAGKAGSPPREGTRGWPDGSRAIRACRAHGRGRDRGGAVARSGDDTAPWRRGGADPRGARRGERERRAHSATRPAAATG
jgi:hypothetical protein